MKTKSQYRLMMVLILISFIFSSGCAQNSAKEKKTEPAEIIIQDTPKTDSAQYLVTIIELGSVRCIPCQKMQPVMKSVEEKYGKQVKVVFHDVWTDAGAPFATKYGIEAIPTQVFLDQNGKEFFRHEGFFPEEELVKVLQTKGVK